MVSLAPIPPDETARLASLQSYDILGTGQDKRFDLFTRLGTWVFGTPFCAIHFIGDETTFFKSAIGFQAYASRRSTSICAHAVGLDESVMAIEDLSQDPRFHDHPLVLNNNFRFYAGVLLRSSSNHALGTFCIADVEPRILSAEDRDKLQALAGGVVS
ncbi:MAG: GAF domain-containing protein, partial [Methylobacterium sp.]